jgi:hypothetical protein
VDQREAFLKSRGLFTTVRQLKPDHLDAFVSRVDVPRSRPDPDETHVNRFRFSARCNAHHAGASAHRVSQVAIAQKLG